jgi:hypothetical protein
MIKNALGPEQIQTVRKEFLDLMKHMGGYNSNHTSHFTPNNGVMYPINYHHYVPYPVGIGSHEMYGSNPLPSHQFAPSHTAFQHNMPIQNPPLHYNHHNQPQKRIMILTYAR